MSAALEIDRVRSAVADAIVAIDTDERRAPPMIYRLGRVLSECAPYTARTILSALATHLAATAAEFTPVEPIRRRSSASFKAVHVTDELAKGKLP